MSVLKGERRRRNVPPTPAFSPLLAFLLAFLLLVPAQASPKQTYFWVDSGSGWLRLSGRHMASGHHAIVYDTANARVGSAAARSVLAAFDRRIYPLESRLFGLPHHCSSVDIVFVPLTGMLLGYFDQNDLVAYGGTNGHSNHSNVLYVRPPSAMPDGNGMADAEEVTAHELQHLIDYRFRVIDHHYPPEEDWLNEGLSFYAQLATGYWTTRDQLKLQAADAQPSWPVVALSSRDPGLQMHARLAYGRAGLFVTYLASRYGSGTARALLASPSTGMQAVSDVLRPRGVSAAAAFSDWGVANFLTTRGRFGYGSYGSTIKPAIVAHRVPSGRSSFRANVALKSWGQAYLRLPAAAGTLHLRISGAGDSSRFALVLQDSDKIMPTAVQWLHVDNRGRAWLNVDGIGTLYDRATLIVNEVSDDHPARTDTIQIEGSVHVRYHD